MGPLPELLRGSFRASGVLEQQVNDSTGSNEIAKLTTTHHGVRSPGTTQAPGPGASALVALRFPLLRDGVSTALRRAPEFGAIGRAEDGQTALDLIGQSKPEVALVDRDLPFLDTAGILRGIAAAGLRTRVVVLAADTASTPACLAMEAGAAGYLTMLSPISEIVGGLLRVIRGETVVAPEFLGQLMFRVGNWANDAERALSPREQEMLTFLTDGRSAPEIAASLNLSVPTVKTHLARLYAKLGVSDRAAAVAVGFRRGLIS